MEQVVSYKKFPNGLPVITVPMPGTDTATVLILVRAGSRLESKKEGGLSHFLEHMLFKGTVKRPAARDITQSLDGLGADYNAFTTKEYTGYYIKVASKHLPIAMDVLSDMLWHSIFDASEMEREKKVIIEEINMYEDNPLFHIGDLLEGAVFKGSGLGTLISGTRESVAAITRKQMTSFWSRFYNPKNMLLVLAGKLSAEHLVRASKVFGENRPAGNISKFSQYQPHIVRPQVALHFKRTEQVQLALGFPSFGWGNPELESLELLGTVLGGNMSSRLFMRLREQEGLCYSVRADQDSYFGTGMFSVVVGLDQKRLPLAIKLIREEIDKVIKEGISADELQRAKEYTRGKLTLAMENSSARSSWIGRRYFLENSRQTAEDYLTRLDRISAESVIRVASKVLQIRRSTLALIGPFKKAGPLQKLLQ